MKINNTFKLGGALINIVFLWLAILATIITFAKISKPAAWLLVPYILWVSFAGYLNYSIWTLNRTIPAESQSYQQEAVVNRATNALKAVAVKEHAVTFREDRRRVYR